MKPTADLDISLQDWISDQGKAAAEGFNQSALQQLLCQRGYEKDLDTSIRKLMVFSPRLLLNSLYESLIKSGMPDNQAADMLKPISDHATEIENEPHAPAHFIWVGPPSQNGRELLGTKSLSKTKPDQPIKLWVLEEHVNAYKEKLKDLKNVTVASIEDYAKKINISFDESETVTLSSQIEKLKRSAEEKISRASPEEKTKGIRDRVTIVDYMKSVIPLYEGGWVFDADVMFLDSDQSPLSKPDKWLFPKIFDGRDYDRDVWFFYRDKAIDWKINKSAGGAFKAETRGEPAWQMLLYIYHLAVIYVDREPALNDLKKLQYYGDGILAMTGRSKNAFVQTLETTLFKDQPLQNLASNWLKENNINNLLAQKVVDISAPTSYQSQSGDLGFRLNYSLYHINATGPEGLNNFNLIKRMNQSYVTDNKVPMVFSYLSVEDKALFKNIVSIMNQCELCNELWIYASGSIPIGPGIRPPIEIESLTALHISALMRPEFFSVLLDVIPEDVLHKLCHDKVNMPGQFFNPFCGALSKFSSENLTALKKAIENDQYNHMELYRTAMQLEKGEQALKSYEIRCNDFVFLKKYLKDHNREDLDAKLCDSGTYQNSISLVEYIFKERPELLEILLPKLDDSEYQKHAPLNLNNCNLKNLTLSSSLLRGCDFSGAHLSNITFSNCKLTGVVINKNTQFEKISAQDNVTCEHFQYRLSDASKALNLQTPDFIRQCQLYYKEQVSQPETYKSEYDAILKILNADGKTNVQKLFCLFESFAQQQKKTLMADKFSLDGFMTLISKRITNDNVVKTFFKQFPPSGLSIWKNRNADNVSISQLIERACQPSDCSLLSSSETGTRRHLIECGVDFTLIDNAEIFSGEKEKHVTEKIMGYCSQSGNVPKSSAPG